MRDQLLPQERVLVGFTYEQLVKPDGEFHYDGHILDRSRKYSVDVI
jgi:hypothetical protein